MIKPGYRDHHAVDCVPTTARDQAFYSSYAAKFLTPRLFFSRVFVAACERAGRHQSEGFGGDEIWTGINRTRFTSEARRLRSAVSRSQTRSDATACLRSANEARTPPSADRRRDERRKANTASGDADRQLGGIAGRLDSSVRRLQKRLRA